MSDTEIGFGTLRVSATHEDRIGNQMPSEGWSHAKLVSGKLVR